MTFLTIILSVVMCRVCVSVMSFCKCVRAMIAIEDGGELPCKQDRIQFLIVFKYFVRSSGAKGGGDWEGRFPPFIAKIDFPIRQNPNRKWSRGGRGAERSCHL